MIARNRIEKTLSIGLASKVNLLRNQNSACFTKRLSHTLAGQDPFLAYHTQYNPTVAAQSKASIMDLVKSGVCSMQRLHEKGLINFSNPDRQSCSGEPLPEFFANRSNTVFFSCERTPPTGSCWVAIKPKPGEKVYRRGYQDLGSGGVGAYHNTAIPFEGYVKWIKSGKDPHSREGLEERGIKPHPRLSKSDGLISSTELLRLDSVPPEDIVAYAKLEKTIALGKNEQLSEAEIVKIATRLDTCLSHYTMFKKRPNTDIRHDRLADRYDIRVAFNREKALPDKAQQEIDRVFSQFSSLSDLRDFAASHTHHAVREDKARV